VSVAILTVLVLLGLSSATDASAFDLLTLDKELVLRAGPGGFARVRVGADRALRSVPDPRCPAVTRVRISSYQSYRFTGEPEVVLPCDGWSKTATGFAYRDPAASAGGVRSIRFGSEGLQIDAGSAQHSPFVGPVGFVHVRFSIDDRRYFVRFHSFSRNDASAVVSPRASRPAAEGERAFWETMLGDRQDSDRALAALARATARNPRDGRSLLLTGMMRLYRFERVEADPRRVSDAGKREIESGAVAMQRALPLLWDGQHGDGRVPGFIGAVIYKKGVAFEEAATIEHGRRLMEEAAAADALFNGFIPFGFGPIAAPDSDDYATILHLLDDVFPTVAGDCGTQPEICFNDGLAPHNLEGSFLLFGDLYTKAGRVDQAVASYELAADLGATNGWKPEFLERARQLADAAPARAALYQDDDPDNDPPFTDFGGAGNCAYCHNR